MCVKLTKRDEVWTTELLGKVRHVIIESDLVNWRSLGILDKCAVEFQLDLDGSIETIKNVSTGEDLEYLEIPDNHGVAGFIKATKPFVTQG